MSSRGDPIPLRPFVRFSKSWREISPPPPSSSLSNKSSLSSRDSRLRNSFSSSSSKPDRSRIGDRLCFLDVLLGCPGLDRLGWVFRGSLYASSGKSWDRLSIWSRRSDVRSDLILEISSLSFRISSSLSWHFLVR